MSNVVAIHQHDQHDLFTDPFEGIPEDLILDRAMAILEQRHTRTSEILASPEDTRRFLRMRMAHLDYEVFGMLILDNRHRVIEVTDLATGTLDGAAVYPREIVKAVLKSGGAAVLLYHNHPSGICDPSQADINLTRRLKEALGLIDVRVLDHFIVSGTDSVSMAERGLV